MNDRERALEAFERVLAVNPNNVRAMTQAGAVLAKKECYPQAVSYLQRAIAADASCGEAWAVLAHCYVMTDDLQKAYQAYQSALNNLPNPRDPNLWYGIGLLYDRYGSLDNALEAFLAVLSISPDFERADEVCFCIGIIYKEQQKFDEALKYFNKVVVAANPPPPLTRADGWYQIGHVNELKRDIPAALDMYKQALAENPKHPKTLQNFGWLEHQHNHNSTEAIRLLKRSAELDSTDGQTWYLLGRVYMALREFRQAYDAYQQAVYRDGRNATFWCSIGVLYYQMNQYRDAMDAYSRAIRLNPYVSEVWYDLGTLYESCGQNADAIDAYRRAAELSPENTQITARLAVLESSVNPSAHQQQAASQPQPTASQQMPQPPQQMQPDMHNSNIQQMQSHLNPVLNRSMAPPIQQQLPQALPQPRLPNHQPSLPSSQLQPPTQQLPGTTSAPSISQSRDAQNPGALPMPERSGQVEMAPIPSLRPPNMTNSQQTGPTTAFSQDGRQNHPAPLPNVQNHLSPMLSQPLPSQSSILPSPSAGLGQQDSMHMTRSGPLPSSHVQSLTHQPHPQLPHIDAQQSQIGHMTSPSQSGQQQQQPQQQHSEPQVTQAMHANSGQNQSPLQPPPPPPHEKQQTQQQTQPHSQPSTHSPGQQQHPHSSMQQQHPNALPQLSSFAQMPPLSQQIPTSQQQPQQQQTNQGDQQGKPGSHPQGANMSGDALTSNSAAVPDSENLRSQYMPGEPMRRQSYEQGDEKTDIPRLPKLQKPENLNNATLPSPTSGREAVASSQPMYSPGQNAGQVVGIGRDHIPPLREPGESGGGPTPPRSMSVHSVTQSETRERSRRDEHSQREGRDTTEPSGAPPQTSHVSDQPGSGRLPAIPSLTGQMQIGNLNRDSREDAKLLNSVAAPSLALPSSNTLPSIIESEPVMPGSSQALIGPPVSGVAGSMGPPTPSLPPLSARTGGLGSSGQEPKDSTGSVLPVSTGLGASSLTKFGKGLVRTPATPVSSSVVPSSLPSPLPTRKNSSGGGGIHGARSPRISKQPSPPAFTSVPVPPSSSYGGQMESVPSPSSLPVLPALSSRPSHDEKVSTQEKTPQEKNSGEAEDGGETRRKPDDGSPKENTDAGSHCRKQDEIGSGAGVRLRSAPAPLQDSDRDRGDKNDKLRSPGSSSAARGPIESIHSSKREVSGKEDSGRSAKRPRLQDVNEKDGGAKPFSYEDEDKIMKGGGNDDSEGREMDCTKAGLGGSSKSDIPSFKDMKAELRRPTGSQAEDEDRMSRRDSSGRSGDADIPKGPSLSSQVIDLPRLSNPSTMPKLPGPPSLGGNTPLPSYLGERMRAGSGSGGKSGAQEGGTRGPLSGLRSMPVSSVGPSMGPSTGPSIGPSLKVIGGSGRGNGERQEYGGPHTMDDNVTKRVSEDKGESSRNASSPRDDGRSDHRANGETQKGNGGGNDIENRGGGNINSKEEKQSSRTEIHSTAS